MSRAEILWHYSSIESLRAEYRDNPPGALSPREQVELQRFRHPGRRNSWLWGRVLGKRLIRESLGKTAVHIDDIEILSRNSDGLGMRPLVCIRGACRRWQLSISHTETGVAAALCRNGTRGLGIDLVQCDSKEITDSFLRTWFTADERRMLPPDKSPAARCEFWAAKEATFKACQRGERFTPRRIHILEHRAHTLDVLFEGDQHQQHCRVDVRLINGHIFALAVVEADCVDEDTPDAAKTGTNSYLSMPRGTNCDRLNRARYKREIEQPSNWNSENNSNLPADERRVALKRNVR